MCAWACFIFLFFLLFLDFFFSLNLSFSVCQCLYKHFTSIENGRKYQFEDERVQCSFVYVSKRFHFSFWSTDWTLCVTIHFDATDTQTHREIDREAHTLFDLSCSRSVFYCLPECKFLFCVHVIIFDANWLYVWCANAELALLVYICLWFLAHHEQNELWNWTIDLFLQYNMYSVHSVIRKIATKPATSSTLTHNFLWVCYDFVTDWGRHFICSAFYWRKGLLFLSTFSLQLFPYDTMTNGHWVIICGRFLQYANLIFILTFISKIHRKCHKMTVPNKQDPVRGRMIQRPNFINVKTLSFALRYLCNT